MRLHAFTHVLRVNPYALSTARKTMPVLGNTRSRLDVSIRGFDQAVRETVAVSSRSWAAIRLDHLEGAAAP
jgi:hypothetical protein